VNNRNTGTQYEQHAASYLNGLGMDILAQNFRCHMGEIDIICKDKEYYVFVEVKYRSTNYRGYPEQAVGKKKQHTIYQVARYYLLTHGLKESTPCRFDVVSVYMGGDVIHIKNAFGGM